MKPRLLDLFCGAGGSAVGYYRAGFEVVGVDIVNQKHYPFEFHQADALTYPLEGFDAYHASPPCKTDNQAVLCRPESNARTKYKRMIAPTRERLIPTGKPYIIENVPLARRQLINPIMLCGTMFGLKVRRHRYFEFNFDPPFPPASCSCGGKDGYTASCHGLGHISSFENGAKLISVAGHNFRVKDAQEAMGIDWCGQEGLSQAIPPTYTEYIGVYLMKEIFEGAEKVRLL